MFNVLDWRSVIMGTEFIQVFVTEEHVSCTVCVADQFQRLSL